MINLTISVSFGIVNLTEFEWHELQDAAQKLADVYVFHTVPEKFEMTQKRLFSYNGVALAVLVRRQKDALEFLFLQPDQFVQEVVHAVPESA